MPWWRRFIAAINSINTVYLVIQQIWTTDNQDFFLQMVANEIPFLGIEILSLNLICNEAVFNVNNKKMKTDLSFFASRGMQSVLGIDFDVSRSFRRSMNNTRACAKNQNSSWIDITLSHPNDAESKTLAIYSQFHCNQLEENEWIHSTAKGQSILHFIRAFWPFLFSQFIKNFKESHLEIMKI